MLTNMLVCSLANQHIAQNHKGKNGCITYVMLNIVVHKFKWVIHFLEFFFQIPDGRIKVVYVLAPTLSCLWRCQTEYLNFYHSAPSTRIFFRASRTHIHNAHTYTPHTSVWHLSHQSLPFIYFLVSLTLVSSHIVLQQLWDSVCAVWCNL